jgi:hypothetical protein
MAKKKQESAQKKPKVQYVDNDEFERLLRRYKRTKDPKTLDQLFVIFKKIINSVYNIAVRNIYNNICPGNFPMPNSHDKEDLIQSMMLNMMTAIHCWKPAHKDGRVKSKAFNYFTCCIVYGIQNELKKELRKGWYKSPVLTKNYIINVAAKMGLDYKSLMVDYDEMKKYE